MLPDNVRKIIPIIVEKIKADYNPQKIILFGSYASGNPDEDSDIDLLIVKNSDERPVDRWIKVRKLLRDTVKNIPVSPLVYTESEIEERKAVKDYFISEILEKGIVLYG